MTLPPAVTSMRRTERLTLPPIEKNAVLPIAFIRLSLLKRGGWTKAAFWQSSSTTVCFRWFLLATLLPFPFYGRCRRP